MAHNKKTPVHDDFSSLTSLHYVVIFREEKSRLEKGNHELLQLFVQLMHSHLELLTVLIDSIYQIMKYTRVKIEE